MNPLAALLASGECAGVGGIELIGKRPFYDEADLPFVIHGGGTVLRIEPARGFEKTSLAASPDEQAMVIDCPDAPGWLVPDGIVAEWMARNVRHDALEDLLVSHPLYEHLTRIDEDGHSRGGKLNLIRYVPGIPEIVSLYGPEFLPDEDAPPINREPSLYAEAVADLLEELQATFRLVEVGVDLRFA